MQARKNGVKIPKITEKERMQIMNEFNEYYSSNSSYCQTKSHPSQSINSEIKNSNNDQEDANMNFNNVITFGKNKTNDKYNDNRKEIENNF